METVRATGCQSCQYFIAKLANWKQIWAVPLLGHHSSCCELERREAHKRLLDGGLSQAVPLMETVRATGCQSLRIGNRYGLFHY